jgi:hypothetical protein
MFRSKWKCVLRCACADARFRVRISPEAWIHVSCEYCVVKYRSLRWADQTSGGVLPSVVYLPKSDREASTMERPWTSRTDAS